MASTSTYLNFPRSTEAAFTFHKTVFGKTLVNGTQYTATVIHGDEAARKQHAEIGFHEGRNKALDQLLELAGKM